MTLATRSMMFQRLLRRASLGVWVLGLAGLGGAYAQSKPTTSHIVVSMPTPLGIPSVPVYFIGKQLGFNDAEGIDVEIHSTRGNVAQGAQLVALGHADVTAITPEAVLVPASQGKQTGLVFVYNFFRRPTYRLVVASDSGITDVSQLKGKIIGINAPGLPAQPLLAAFLADRGMNSSDVDTQVVGQDAPADEALKNGRVAALLQPRSTIATWEVAGYKFTELGQPARFKTLFGSSWAVERSSLKDPVKRVALVKFFRTLAEATVYTKANPEAAVEADFAMFPSAKPARVSNAEALRQGTESLKIVMDDYTSNTGKLGEFPAGVLASYVDFLGLKDKIASPDSLYSNELIDEVNAFDRDAIIKKALAAH